MDIYFNDEPAVVADGISLYDFLISTGVNPERTVIELNDELVERAAWKETLLAENDRVLAVTFVGGG
ncbi:MAG: sulfur carrier protein ThiS [Victivallaceae bacterium]|jgi:thiamine biosynthesis protein ThiS|nr:sulfur carrier protein ThiS [Victivallaceae bacterium]NLK83625.1 sulfur carrier protein ThiS [Lentisphaerota bacterium]MDD3117254.1 sulfur carrier protein ThiS [Victivallaceae bacterium]MDD3704014.1 sulfur carrier protein ThiS [Victivallaceae bacterium]MDD4317043.1 sulfur carrier protein ThiS [Victivallaceae bacterium]